MMHKVIFATGNEGKMKEIREILADLDMEVLSMKQAGLHLDIVEDGTSFEQNAMIKAKAVWQHTGEIVLADDSGLEIDYLGGQPGIYSARYLEDKSYEEKNRILIERLAGAEEGQRCARFRCAIAAVLPDGTQLLTQASMEGQIAYQPAGDGGFGYDPILYLPEYQKTAAQLTMEQKNQVSHRGKALQAMKEKLKTICEEQS